MHPRNIFKENKPDFQELAKVYPEFSPYVYKGAAGKPYVDFKDPAALRALSTVLLKKYFDISIEVPLDRLIPTIPLRLNYIHWIEDLVGLDMQNDIMGIDVGCGASCIYGLLGNKMNKWRFISTEIDEESFQYAQQNVKRNHAEQNITVLHTDEKDTLLKSIVDGRNTKLIDFTMCNPPFYSETIHEPNDHVTINRTNHRPPPSSISTANEKERFTDGGEVVFVQKMIQESLELKNKIGWYTSMLGKKSSMKPLLKMMKESKITNVTTTEFQQGRTTRWGLAWTFTETTKKLPPSKKKKAKPFHLSVTDDFYQQFSIPPVTAQTPTKELLSSLSDITKIVEKELEKLKVAFEKPECIRVMNSDAYKITGNTFQNTWIHQRQKRRKANQKNDDVELTPVETVNASGRIVDIEPTVSNISNGTQTVLKTEAGASRKRQLDDENINNTCDEKRTKLDTCNKNSDLALFGFTCTVGMAKQFHVVGSTTPTLSLLCVEGNRDLFHQMILYLKNTLHCTQVNAL